MKGCHTSGQLTATANATATCRGWRSAVEKSNSLFLMCVFILVRSTARLHHLVAALQLHFGYKRSNMGDFDTEKCIILIQEKQGIWNVSSEEYKNRDKKIDAWKEILEELHPDSNLWTPEERKIKGADLQKKWKNIKDRFIKDHRMYSKSGSGACKRKKYVYYDILQFLVAQTERRNTESNVSQEARSPELNEDGQEEAEEFPQSLQGASNIQRPTAATSRSKNNFEKKLLDILESRQPPIAHNDENDDDLNFFKSLLPTLKTLDEQQKMEFRVQMMQSLQKIKKWPYQIPSHYQFPPSFPHPSESIYSPHHQFYQPPISFPSTSTSSTYPYPAHPITPTPSTHFNANPPCSSSSSQSISPASTSQFSELSDILDL